jgi:cation diffusion facilitator CzcD-associated flavoprotein CzcO
MGAGPGGLCMGIKLKEAGFSDFVILEKSSQVGGTWNHNRYPGCACDIPSHLYSFSFEFKPDWSRPYAPQPEILEYMEFVAEKYQLLPHCRFGDGVRNAAWADSTSRWTVTLESGDTVEADVVVSAIGMFNDIVFPDIKGLDSFAGKNFHSSQWDWDYSLEGKTVGVVGSAASAVQLIPEIAKEAGQVHLFQRTANWVLPKEDTPYTEEQVAAFRANPEVAWAIRQEIFDGIESGQAFHDRAIRSDMEATILSEIDKVDDQELRKKLVPTHEWGCKRPLFSNDYYLAFNRPNLELVTEAIERITPRGIVTTDGVEREVDVLVLATGFAATKYLSCIDVTGRKGLDLADAWSDGAQAYKGITTAGFPNLFMLYGPNTNQGSLITMIEWEAEHAVKHIQRISEEELAFIDVKPEPMATYHDQLQKDIAAVVPWQAGGCNGYYRSPSGRVVTQWPHNMSAYRASIDEIEADVFEAVPLETRTSG